MAYTAPNPIPEEDLSSPNSLLIPTSRCCFCIPLRRSSSTHASDGGGIRVLMKVREWSELVAGPKWKTFIRRFNRNTTSCCRGGVIGGGQSRFSGRNFQYDPLSYALNFDEGQNVQYDDDDDFGGFRDFSTRYASVPGSGRPMGLEPMHISSKDNTSSRDVPVVA